MADRKRLDVEVLIPERSVYSGKADSVTLPGLDGIVGVLPKHARTVVRLDIGEMVLRDGSRTERIALGGGFANIDGSSVKVVAKVAERAAEIDLRRAEEAKRRVEETLTRQGAGTSFVGLEAALHRAITRIRVATGR